MKEDIQEPRWVPEQELGAEPLDRFTMKRRDFLKVLGGGIAISFTTSAGFAASFADNARLSDDIIGAWIHIGKSGRITVYTGKVEVGQNIRTSLAQLVAEELAISIEKIDLVMGDTALTPFDRGTFGSLSIPQMGPQLRKAAASAREVLLDMAAETWKADRALLYVEDGEVKNRKTAQRLSIGELAQGKEIVKPLNEKVALKPVEQWKVAGTTVLKSNGASFLTGKHKYVSDMRLPDMLFGKILRAPAFGATLLSADTAAARSIPGVTVVQDGEFIGVTASTLEVAAKALKAIKTEWKTVPQPSRQDLFGHLLKTAESAKDRDPKSAGDVEEAVEKATVKIDQTFKVDYIAHVPLEPRAGVAQWTDGKLTVWTGTQRPFGVQEELEKVFQISKENIRVIMPDTGSGYGGKHTGEAGIEAARLAKVVGRPVKVVWTREEEFTWAYFRPAGVIQIKAGANTDGIVTAWEFHTYNAGPSGIETPYDVAAKRIQFHPSESPLRQGSYRGLAATANVFSRECIMNDLAVMLKMDPLDFRIKNLKDERMRNVLEAAAKAFGWHSRTPVKGNGFGIGCGNEKGSYVATCAEVSIDRQEGAVKVIRIVVAFECGAIVNPRHLESQIEGAVIQGLGGALFERIDFKGGQIINNTLSQYRVPRFSDMPEVEVVMLNRKDIPSVGAGETPIVGVAPAVRNAIAHATGKKLYTLPLVADGLSI